MFNVLLMCLEEKINFAIYLTLNWTSLVVQWLRICLPIKGTWVLSLTQEDPTCHGATKPMHHNYWVHALEPVSCSYWVWRPPLLSPQALEPLVCNKRSHHKEKPVLRNQRVAPSCQNWRKPMCSNEDSEQPKISKI